MSTEKSIIYWIGQEPTGPGQSPTLDQMPAAVSIVPLAFCGIDVATNSLTYGLLTEQNSAATIQGWIKTVRANGTKVVLSILSTAYEEVDPQQFAQNVKRAVAEWGVDGIDLDYEPPTYDPKKQQHVLAVVKALRLALGADALLMAPIYSAWSDKSFLQDYAAQLDLLTTMDYTPYSGLAYTEQQFEKYAHAIGSSEKLAVGVSCMSGPKSPHPNNFTPLADVITLTQWEPANGTKAGVMLYTFSYDLKVRMVTPKNGNPYDAGTGQPDETWTNTILKNLP
ncbi:glycoside hydrolase family 18 protein [Hymenobacter negativus]|uniref:mannosyl-glycoprotein endo-beta-N-acetylglucosaminidase n=1 Tax=Hymenobacter negativus TaxID=2795026 RepID=A0ABS3QI90_9BACT|nr:glycoside hydrolase family 18 protein [Hymenobacter negativus]MBO2010949.1 hypothetical protein [Hymenobacter negativus]